MKQIIFFLHILLLLTACASSRGALHSSENSSKNSSENSPENAPRNAPENALQIISVLPSSAQPVNSPSALA
ncbi:MAG: lipoprotein, partial [Alloprevotella sp.]|nr:lipoprotein [Alloprevotella sp.]